MKTVLYDSLLRLILLALGTFIFIIILLIYDMMHAPNYRECVVKKDEQNKTMPGSQTVIKEYESNRKASEKEAKKPKTHCKKQPARNSFYQFIREFRKRVRLLQTLMMDYD